MKKKGERVIPAATAEATILKEPEQNLVLLFFRSFAMYGMMLVVVSAVMQSISHVTLLEYYHLLTSLEKTGFLVATAVPVVSIAGFCYDKV